MRATRDGLDSAQCTVINDISLLFLIFLWLMGWSLNNMQVCVSKNIVCQYLYVAECDCCNWRLELQMASHMSLRCFCCCNTNCYATIKSFPPPGINWPLWFSSTGPEIPTTQCILFCFAMT
jgi:hypothetical protein